MLSCLVVLVALGGCADVEQAEQVQPDSAQDGVQATGRIDGARVAISRGAPTVVDGDCDPNTGLDDDLCILSRTINGQQINLVVENPDVLVAGEQLEIDERPCGTTGCDDVTDVAVLDVRIDGEQRPVESGRLDVSQVGERVAAEFDLSLPGGDRLTGAFDVALPRVPVVIGPDGSPTEGESSEVPEP